MFVLFLGIKIIPNEQVRVQIFLLLMQLLMAALQIGFAFGFWTHSLEMDEWSGSSWFKPGM